MSTDACSLLVCRGCCCGKPRGRHDTAGQHRLGRLRAALEPAVEVETTHECLGPCSHADVVVVRPSAEARRAGARPCWLGWTDHEVTLGDLTSWLLAGGPGVAEPPSTLELHRFNPRTRKPAQRPRASRARTKDSHG